MSNSPSKPGGSGIDDLRARLGLDSFVPKSRKPASGGPGARGPSPSPASARPQDDDDAPTPIPASAPAPVLSPPAVSLGQEQPLVRPPDAGGFDEDEATRPFQVDDLQAPGAILDAPPPDMDPLAFLEKAPEVRKSIEQRMSPAPATAAPQPEPATAAPQPEPAAPRAEPAPPKPVDVFESPLSAPAPSPPVQPLAPPPPELLERSVSLGDETIAALAPMGKKRLMAILVTAGLVLAIAAPLGYAVGRIGKDRMLINKRIDQAERVLVPVKKSVGKIKGILQTIQRMDPSNPDFELAERLKTFNCLVSVEEIAGDNLLLGRMITSELMGFVALANRFHREVRRHGRLTATKHREYLEQIAQANKALQGDQDIYVYFKPNPKPGGQPPKGHLVTLTGPPEKQGKEVVVPVRPLMATESRKVNVNLLIGLDRSELLQSAGPNVLQLYAERVKRLKDLAKELDRKMDPLVRMLEKEASKPKVMSF